MKVRSTPKGGASSSTDARPMPIRSMLAGMVSGFALAVAYEVGWIGAGPGAMWKTIAPWIGAFAAMALAGATRNTRVAGELGVGEGE